MQKVCGLTGGSVMVALAQSGHPAEALAKYDGALRHAPNWDALKQARDLAGRRSWSERRK